MVKELRVGVCGGADEDVAELERLLREGGFEPEIRLIDERADLAQLLEEWPAEALVSGLDAAAADCRSVLAALGGDEAPLPFIVASRRVAGAEAAGLVRQGAAACVAPERLAAALLACRRETDCRRSRAAAVTGMREAAAKYRDIYVNATEGLYQATPAGRLIDVNPALARIFGYASPQAMLAGVRDLVRDLFVDDACRAAYARGLEGPAGTVALEPRLRRRDGGLIWASLKARAMRDPEDGQLLYVEGALEDVTARRQAEEELRRAQAKYRSIFENSVEGIFQSSPEGRYLSANPALARIYGYGSPEELMADLTDIERRLYVDPGRREEFRRLVESQGVVVNFESEVRRRDGRTIWIVENARAVRDESGETLYYEGAVAEITERKKNEALLRRQAFHDALTGLPNRALFLDRLKRSLKRRRRRCDYSFAVLFLDLDRFKVVNDSLGHLCGDSLLVETAARLEQCVRAADTVARFGGDEFAILLEDVPDILSATHVIERIQEELDKPYRLGSQQIFSGASIGVVLRAQEYDLPEHIIRDADIAMYRAKSLGKSRYEIFDARMRQQASSLLKLETDLRRAIERREFVVYYQPIVSLASGQVTKFEALLRWNHPEQGLVLPGDFIPVAEDTGLIMPIGEWVLKSACQTISRWRARHGDQAPSLAVNLSAKQFMKPDLAPFIAGLLRQFGAPAHCLELEITESRIMDNAEYAAKALRQLKDLGVRISIDDFGTGYSSLAYLHRFPIDSVKIDRSFVSSMDSDQDKAQIVETIVGLAHALGLDVVAEGVELDAQCRRLGGMACEFAQGFLFSRPLPGDTADELLDAMCGAGRACPR